MKMESAKITTFFITIALIILASTGNSIHNEDICGKQIVYTDVEIKLVRGSFPWIATILKRDGEFVCSGTLVTTQKVVTAASCLQNHNTRDLFIWLGGHDMRNFIESDEFLSSVQSIHIHPSWKLRQKPHDNDIAVLILKQKVQPNMYIQPICLVDHTTNVSSLTDGIVVGYGSDEVLKQKNLLVPKLVTTSILRESECLKRNRYIQFALSELTFCASWESSLGICKGDDGSGLFVTDGKQFFLRGIIPALSNEVSCEFSSLRVFVDVMKSKEWITSINEDSFKKHEFLTIWIPNKVYDEKDYNVVLLSNDIDKRTEIALQFRKSYGTVTLATEKVQKITVKNIRKSGAKKNFELFMTLHRNESTSTGTRHMCITETIHNIEAEKRQFYTFIQTDKQIYKPSDTVRFRVVVVDRDLKPYHMNFIRIEITNSLNQIIEIFDDLGEMFMGVFTENFSLSTNTPLGIWKIHAVIDKIDRWETFKEFSVQKLEPFKIFINLENNHLLTNSTLDLTFFARKSPQIFIHGNVQLNIKCLTSNQLILTKYFSNISSIMNVKYKVIEDLKAITNSKYEYEAEITFTELKSGISLTKSAKFTVHSNKNFNIKSIHPEKFIPRLPFEIRFQIFDWKQSLIKSSHQKIKVAYTFSLLNGTEEVISTNLEIKNGNTLDNFIVTNDVEELRIYVTYFEATYEKTILKDHVVIEANKIYVDFIPKSPHFGDTVTVYTKTDFKVDQIIAMLITRHGLVESYQVFCDYDLICKFYVTFTREMMPETRIKVYFVKEKGMVYEGVAIMKTDRLGPAILAVNTPAYIEAGKSVNIAFTTHSASYVYFLGHFNDSADFYDLAKDDLIKELGNFDKSINIIEYEIEETNWHECNNSEIKRISKGTEAKRYTSANCNQHANLLELKGNPEVAVYSFEQTNTNWLFDEFDMENGTATKSLVVPDGTTSLIGSTFLMSEDYGLEFWPPLEVIVKN